MASEGEIVRVTVHYTQPGAGDCQNVFHFEITQAAPSDGDVLADLETWFATDWAPEWANISATTATLSHIDIDVVSVAGLVVRNIGSAFINENGDSVSDIMPAAVSLFLMAYTALPKQRGSKYLPGVTEDVVNGGYVNPAHLAQLAVLLGLYMADIPVGGAALLIPGLLSKTLATFLPFTAAGAIETLPAYQRRRKAGVGI